MDIIHDLSEFQYFPWEKLDADWFHQIGGIGHDGQNQPFITFLLSDLTCDRWMIPQPLERLLEEYRWKGKQEKSLEVQRALAAVTQLVSLH